MKIEFVNVYVWVVDIWTCVCSLMLPKEETIRQIFFWLSIFKLSRFAWNLSPATPSKEYVSISLFIVLYSVMHTSDIQHTRKLLKCQKYWLASVPAFTLLTLRFCRTYRRYDMESARKKGERRENRLIPLSKFLACASTVHKKEHSEKYSSFHTAEKLRKTDTFQWCVSGRVTQLHK